MNISMTAFCNDPSFPLLETACNFHESSTTVKVATFATIIFSSLLFCYRWLGSKKNTLEVNVKSPIPSTPFVHYADTPANGVTSPRTPAISSRHGRSFLEMATPSSIRRLFSPLPQETTPSPENKREEHDPFCSDDDDGYPAGNDSDLE